MVLAAILAAVGLVRALWLACQERRRLTWCRRATGLARPRTRPSAAFAVGPPGRAVRRPWLTPISPQVGWVTLTPDVAWCHPWLVSATCYLDGLRRNSAL